jgi:hypothetical protein
MRRRQLFVFAIVLIAPTFVGCSSGGRGSLAGKVTYQGKTVAYGTVMAVCSDGVTRSSNIAEDGSYRIEDVPTGMVKLGVVSPEPPDPGSFSGRQGGRGGGGETPRPPTIDRSRWFAIPEALGDPRNSGQETNVAAGANSFDIQLK